MSLPDSINVQLNNLRDKTTGLDLFGKDSYVNILDPKQVFGRV